MRIWLCLIAIGIALGPLFFVAGNINLVDPAPEFVYYRIGDALSLRYGESQYVIPVQGIPTATLSKAIVPLTEPLNTRESLRGYGALWMTILCAIVLASIVYAWKVLPTSAATAQAFMLGLPFWAGTASIGLMIAPEYWLGEWAFLGIVFALMPLLPKLDKQTAYIVVGVLAGIAASIKITLFPIALVLAVYIGELSPRRGFLLIGVAVVTFTLLDFIYMGGDVQETARLLRYQAIFYVRPNASAVYPDAMAAFTARAPFVALFFSVVTLCLLKRTRLALAMLAWIAVYGYLTIRRPHDTSLASFALSLGFMAAVLSTQFPKHSTIVLATLAVFTVGAFAVQSGPLYTVQTLLSMARFDEEMGKQIKTADQFFSDSGRVVWYMPTNHWNAAYGPQGIAYNGSLKLRPDSRIFDRLFPDTDVLAASPPKGLRTALNCGSAIYWTRPAEDQALNLFAELDGSLIEERQGIYRGTTWVFGKAHLRQLGQTSFNSSGVCAKSISGTLVTSRKTCFSDAICNFLEVSPASSARK